MRGHLSRQQLRLDSTTRAESSRAAVRLRWCGDPSCAAVGSLRHCCRCSRARPGCLHCHPSTRLSSLHGDSVSASIAGLEDGDRATCARYVTSQRFHPQRRVMLLLAQSQGSRLELGGMRGGMNRHRKNTQHCVSRLHAHARPEESASGESWHPRVEDDWVDSMNLDCCGKLQERVAGAGACEYVRSEKCSPGAARSAK